MPFQPVKLSITKEQQKKALRGAPIRLTKSAITNGTQIVMLHPLNVKKITKSANGVNLQLSPGEIMATASHHKMVPNMDTSNMEGSGLFDTIWSGIKSVGSWLKDSGVGSALADVAQNIAAPIVGEDVAKGGRSILKGLTGVGIKKKGSSAPKGSGLYL